MVDDDPQMLRFVRDALLGEGYAPLVAADHHKLPDLLEAEKPVLGRARPGFCPGPTASS